MFSDLSRALLTGVVAGLALALPFGALAVLLVDTGMRSTRRVSLFAAAGVGCVDLGFALASALVGTAVTEGLHQWAWQVQVGSALVVFAMGGYAWRSASRSGRADEPTPAAAGSGDLGVERRTMLRFAVLTATNPITTLTLTAMAAGLTPASSRAAAAVAFAAGCGAVSLSWHALLALGGHLLGSRLSRRARRIAAHVGAAATMGLALTMALSTAAVG